MELNPKLRLRRPIEVPFSNPNKTTVCPSIAFGSKNRKRCATWRVQKVTMRCQLVNVVAALITNTYGLPVSIELNTCNSAQFNAHSSSRIGWKPMICALMFIRYHPCMPVDWRARSGPYRMETLGCWWGPCCRWQWQPTTRRRGWETQPHRAGNRRSSWPAAGSAALVSWGLLPEPA